MKKLKIFFIKPPVIIGILLIIGFTLRLFFAKNLGCFSFDEIFSVHFSSFGFKKMVGYLIYDNNPPLYAIILHYWLKIFGDNEIIVRLLSIIFNLASIITIYFLGKVIFNKRVGVIVAFLFTIAPLCLNYGTEARMYSLLLFLVILATLLFWKFLKKPTPGKGIAYGLACLFLLFTHILSLYVILFLNIYYFINYFYYKEKKIRINHWLFLQILIFIIYLGWFLPFFITKIYVFSSINNLNDAWFAYGSPIINFFNSILKYLFFISPIDFYLEPLVNIFIILTIYAFFKFTLNKERALVIAFDINKEKIFLLLFLILFLIPGFIFSYSVIRYYLVILPSFYLLLAQAMAKFSNKILLIIIIIISLITFSDNKLLYSQIENQQTINDYLVKTAGGQEKIIIHNFAYKLVFDKYYQGKNKVEGFYPLADDLNEDKRLLLKNAQRIVDEENVKKLAQSTFGYDKIILIFSLDWDKSGQELIFNWFLEKGYRLVQQKKFVDSEISLFQK